MAESHGSTFNLKLRATQVNALDLGNVSFPVSEDIEYIFQNGTGANKAQKMFADTRTIAASTNDDLDLAGGLTDAFGQSISFDNLKAIYIRASSANLASLRVGGPASGAIVTLFVDTSDIINVAPGGIMLLVAPTASGYGVTSTTADKLRISNPHVSDSITYDIVLIGE